MNLIHVSFIDSETGRINKRDNISVKQSVHYLSDELKADWSIPPWNETLRCNRCNPGFDGVLTPGSNLIYDRELRVFTGLNERGERVSASTPQEAFDLLSPDIQTRVCHDAVHHRDSIKYMWDEEGTSAYLHEMIGLADTTKSKRISMHMAIVRGQIASWFLAYRRPLNTLRLSDEEQSLVKPNKNGEIFYIDTLGRNQDNKIYARWGTKALMAATVKEIFLSKITKTPVITRTHINAQHVLRFAKDFCDITKIGYSLDDPERVYYQLDPNLSKSISQICKQVFPLPIYRLGKGVSFLFKSIIRPEDCIQDIIKFGMIRARTSDDPVGIVVAKRSQAFLKQNKEILDSRLKSCAMDVRVAAATALLLGYVYPPVIGYIASSNSSPIFSALAGAELISLALPMVAGLAGIVRGIYMGTKSVYYKYRYGDALKPKLLLSLTSMLDGGWLMSPLLALKDDNGVLKDLAKWNAKDVGNKLKARTLTPALHLVKFLNIHKFL